MDSEECACTISRLSYLIIAASLVQSILIFIIVGQVRSLYCGPVRWSGVGGKSVRQADVSGGTHFPRKLCPTGQDILSVLG